MSLRIAAYGSKENSQKLDKEAFYLGEKFDLQRAKGFLSGCMAHDIVLILNANQVSGGFEDSKIEGDFQGGETDVLFAASAAFHYDDEGLRYYFWKFYPRGSNPYHYLDADAFIGKAQKVIKLVEQIEEVYPTGYSWHDLSTRFYVDVLLGATKTDVQVQIDRNQSVFGNLKGRVSAVRWPMLSWVQLDLFNRFESEGLASRKVQEFADTLRDYKGRKNRITKNVPQIWILPGDQKQVDRISLRYSDEKLSKPGKVLWTSFSAYLQSLWSFFIALLINRGATRSYRIFRYTANKNPEWKQTMTKFLAHLENREGFTFAHFNDGEMTFIKKYLNENHAETWFGRRQQKYNKDLGERLTDALKLEMDKYYVGVPCSIHHPKLRKLADSLTQGHSGVVPAMSLHHNPRYFPNLINHMKDRECFFIKNEFQRLDIFEKLGVEIKEENQLIVPFKNSYLLYDEIKDRKFPDGAIVILICGMLAKIIIPVWFENNPNTTFIALGSSMDDFIQRTNTKFTLYPKEGLPLTCNIQPTKFFAFGWKKECPECWEMEEYA